MIAESWFSGETKVELLSRMLDKIDVTTKNFFVEGSSLLNRCVSGGIGTETGVIDVIPMHPPMFPYADGLVQQIRDQHSEK